MLWEGREIVIWFNVDVIYFFFFVNNYVYMVSLYGSFLICSFCCLCIVNIIVIVVSNVESCLISSLGFWKVSKGKSLCFVLSCLNLVLEF